MATPAAARHPLDPLSATEIRRAAAVARSALPASTTAPRFVSVSLREPVKSALGAYEAAATGDAPLPPRVAEAILIAPETGLAYVVLVALALPASADEDACTACTQLPRGTQPMFTPDDNLLAEEIVKADAGVQVWLLVHALWHAWGCTPPARAHAYRYSRYIWT